MEIKTENAVVNFSDTQEMKDRVFRAVIDFFVELEVFNGEGCAQNDSVTLGAPEFLGKLCDDIIKFRVDWKD